MIAILIPGKLANYPDSYRHIALLCCFFKLLERRLLTRTSQLIVPTLPSEQADFRSGRDNTEQVLALTSYIDSRFERKQKAGNVLFYLSAAYDTVWQCGLMLKLVKIIRCKETINLLRRMTVLRVFQMCLENDMSKCLRIKNGVPQGSVLAPAFFKNLHWRHFMREIATVWLAAILRLHPVYQINEMWR